MPRVTSSPRALPFVVSGYTLVTFGLYPLLPRAIPGSPLGFTLCCLGLYLGRLWALPFVVSGYTLVAFGLYPLLPRAIPWSPLGFTFCCLGLSICLSPWALPFVPSGYLYVCHLGLDPSFPRATYTFVTFGLYPLLPRANTFVAFGLDPLLFGAIPLHFLRSRCKRTPRFPKRDGYSWI
jgi:hypothetical protein